MDRMFLMLLTVGWVCIAFAGACASKIRIIASAVLARMLPQGFGI
jgi:hypothetical protein